MTQTQRRHRSPHPPLVHWPTMPWEWPTVEELRTTIGESETARGLRVAPAHYLGLSAEHRPVETYMHRHLGAARTWERRRANKRYKEVAAQATHAVAIGAVPTRGAFWRRYFMGGRYSVEVVK